eukprot:TRINITY_DN26489_c0_g1_i1.p1 TRINITY_DN26489_c0_g1~~TRINITY_DN26489_c0_g1_i1.p1  ORF type:complete len:171 (+),score=33.14 TRINITY_DN26489_c0_g1_i1:52-513(+)
MTIDSECQTDSKTAREGPTIIKERLKKRKLMSHDAAHLSILKLEALVSNRERAIATTLTRQMKQQKAISNLIHEISPLVTLVLYSLRVNWPWLLYSADHNKDDSISSTEDHLSNKRSIATEADITEVITIQSSTVITAYELWKVSNSICGFPI